MNRVHISYVYIYADGLRTSGIYVYIFLVYMLVIFVFNPDLRAAISSIFFFGKKYVILH